MFNLIERSRIHNVAQSISFYRKENNRTFSFQLMAIAHFIWLVHREWLIYSLSCSPVPFCIQHRVKKNTVEHTIHVLGHMLLCLLFGIIHQVARVSHSLFAYRGDESTITVDTRTTRRRVYQTK